MAIKTKTKKSFSLLYKVMGGGGKKKKHQLDMSNFTYVQRVTHIMKGFSPNPLDTSPYKSHNDDIR